MANFCVCVAVRRPNRFLVYLKKEKKKSYRFASVRLPCSLTCVSWYACTKLACAAAVRRHLRSCVSSLGAVNFRGTLSAIYRDTDHGSAVHRRFTPDVPTKPGKKTRYGAFVSMFLRLHSLWLSPVTERDKTLAHQVANEQNTQ